jgi:hypothetical protein
MTEKGAGQAVSRSGVPFHIQQVARPEWLELVLSIPFDGKTLDAHTMYLRVTQEGHPITLNAVQRSLDLGKKLGLFERIKRISYVLTDRGQACRNLALYHREEYCDAMHFLLFSTWALNGQRDYWSWSYAKTCEILWRDRPTVKSRQAIFGELSAEASKEFPDLDPVVGTETIYAVTNWLRELSPPFLVTRDDRSIASREREWFSIGLALLSVLYLYAARGAAFQTPLLMDRDTIEQLCPLCLAPPDRIVAMIETASRTFPALDIHTGEWGSSVILRQSVDINTLI